MKLLPIGVLGPDNIADFIKAGCVGGGLIYALIAGNGTGRVQR